MTKRCIIISGGEYSPITDIKKNDFIIACDHGYDYALKDSIKPNLIIGDFDSFEGDLNTDIPIDRYKSEKDDTDTMIAVKYAVSHDYDEIIIYCALGGRLDHTMGNLQAAAFAANHGLKVMFSSTDNVIYTITNSTLSLNRRNGYSLSLFSLTDTCTQVSAQGVKYPLDNATITNSFPIGVSNEWTDDTAIISVKSGILMVVMSKL